MELPTIDNTDAYIDVCKKAGLPVNKLPKKGDKLDLAYEIAMKTINPALYQNLMSPSPDDLPADVSKRYKQGLMWIDDLKAYEDAGFTGTAICDNIIIGREAGYAGSFANGKYNTIMGMQAGCDVTSGEYNTLFVVFNTTIIHHSLFTLR